MHYMVDSGETDQSRYRTWTIKQVVTSHRGSWRNPTYLSLLRKLIFIIGFVLCNKFYYYYYFITMYKHSSHPFMGYYYYLGFTFSPNRSHNTNYRPKVIDIVSALFIYLFTTCPYIADLV